MGTSKVAKAARAANKARRIGRPRPLAIDACAVRGIAAQVVREELRVLITQAMRAGGERVDLSIRALAKALGYPQPPARVSQEALAAADLVKPATVETIFVCPICYSTKWRRAAVHPDVICNNDCGWRSTGGTGWRHFRLARLFKDPGEAGTYGI